MPNKLGISVVMALTVLMFAAGCGGGESAPAPTPIVISKWSDTEYVPTPTEAPAASAAAAGEIVKVGLKENPYVYAPETYTFEKGKTYTLDFEAPGEFHTFTVEELGINIFINANEAIQQSITPSLVGSFKLTCVPHETSGMVGTVTVS